MDLYAQHGYGKSNKLREGLVRKIIQGVILSPRDESPTNMSQLVRDIRTQDSKAQILFDPQFYVTTIAPSREGNLNEYPFYQKNKNLTRASFMAPSNVREYVKRVIDYQISLGATAVISPTVLFDGFHDPMSQIALSLAGASIEYLQPLRKENSDIPPLFISVAFSEYALGGAGSGSNFDAFGQYLDILQMLETDGFYVLVRRQTPTYQAGIDANPLEQLMYLVYVLSVLGEHKVVLGYTDLMGIVLHAVGATATACGWHQSLRYFSTARFEPISGGRPARPRYTSGPLLNSILLSPDLANLYQRRLLPEVLSNSSFDTILSANPPQNASKWSNDASCLHHWETLGTLCREVSSQGSPTNNLNCVSNKIARAKALYATAERLGVIFDPTTGSQHLTQWQHAIANFRQQTGI